MVFHQIFIGFSTLGAVSKVNLLARTSLVMFSITAIIFLAFALSAWVQRAMLKPIKLPP